jgi:hypothetical protein
MLSCVIDFEGERFLSTIVRDSDVALAFGTIALIVVSIVGLALVLMFFRRIRDALVKWYYRRKYAAEFRRRDRQ